MGSRIKIYKSITNSMRHVYLINKNILCQKKAIKHLASSVIKSKAGRNNSGKITVHTKGKKFYNNKPRRVSYKRFNYNISGYIYRYEYDPNRSSFISLIIYKNYICCYILGVKNTFKGDIIHSYNFDIMSDEEMNKIYKKGDSNKLLYLPVGSFIHNIERFPNSGGVYARSAGTYGQIFKKDIINNKALIILPSNKKLYLSLNSYATLGVVSNERHKDQVIGKAGRNRWLGKKSKVRGVAMNPVDHPHGGGEGKKSPTYKKTPWGKIKKWVNKKILHEKYVRKK